jgi:hypothetical protein
VIKRRGFFYDHLVSGGFDSNAPCGGRLLLGFAGAFRRSELVALDCEDIEETAEGLKIIIRRSKTDQEAAGGLSLWPEFAAATAR